MSVEFENKINQISNTTSFLINVQERDGGSIINLSKQLLQILPSAYLMFGFNPSLNRLIFLPIEECNPNAVKVVNLGNSGRVSNKALVSFIKKKGFSGKIYFMFDQKEKVFYSVSEEEAMPTFSKAKQKRLIKTTIGNEETKIQKLEEKIQMVSSELLEHKKAIRTTETKIRKLITKISSLKENLEKLEADQEVVNTRKEKRDIKELTQKIHTEEKLLNQLTKDVGKSKSVMNSCKTRLTALKTKKQKLSKK